MSSSLHCQLASHCDISEDPKREGDDTDGDLQLRVPRFGVAEAKRKLVPVGQEGDHELGDLSASCPSSPFFGSPKAMDTNGGSPTSALPYPARSE